MYCDILMSRCIWTFHAKMYLDISMPRFIWASRCQDIFRHLDTKMYLDISMPRCI